MNNLDMDKVERAKQNFIYGLKSFELTPPKLTTEQFIELFKGTQADKVLWHLMNFRRITSRQSKIYYIDYCSSAVRDLEDKFKEEKSNYWIRRDKVSNVNFLNQKRNFTEYVLEEGG